MREEGTSRAKAPRLLDWSFPQHPPPNTGFWSLFRDCRVWSVLSYSSSWTHGNAKPPQRDRTRVCPPCPLSSPLPSSLVRSYKGSLRQDGAGWIPLPPPGLDLQAIELATENNHYCHAQKDLDSHWDPKKERARRQLYVASAICLVFMIGEVIGGYLAHSLAIMTDAAHLLTDFASMLISLFSLWMSSRAATKTMNFGWQRAEILGALLSVLSIWVVTGILVYLAVERLISGDYEIEGGTMLITSGCAVAVNIIMGLTLHQSGHGHSHDTSQQQENLSVRAAFIHVIGDFLQSLGILVAAYVVYFKDPFQILAPFQLWAKGWGEGRNIYPTPTTRQYF
nr:zinc transporter 2 isoform X4 [Equus caballus]